MLLGPTQVTFQSQLCVPYSKRVVTDQKNWPAPAKHLQDNGFHRQVFEKALIKEGSLHGQITLTDTIFHKLSPGSVEMGFRALI